MDAEHRLRDTDLEPVPPVPVPALLQHLLGLVNVPLDDLVVRKEQPDPDKRRRESMKRVRKVKQGRSLREGQKTKNKISSWQSKYEKLHSMSISREPLASKIEIKIE